MKKSFCARVAKKREQLWHFENEKSGLPICGAKNIMMQSTLNPQYVTCEKCLNMIKENKENN